MLWKLNKKKFQLTYRKKFIIINITYYYSFADGKRVCAGAEKGKDSCKVGERNISNRVLVTKHQIKVLLNRNF